MKLIQIPKGQKSAVAVIATILLAVLAVPSITFATGQQDGTLNIEVLPVNHTIVQGEPITLVYKITNSSQENVEMDMGRDKEGWFTIKVTNSTGREAQPVTELPSPLFGGVSPANPGLAPGGSLQGTIEVGHWATIPNPGNFTLTFQTHLSYRTSSSSDQRTTSDSTFSRGYSFPVVVIPANHQLLRAKASSHGANIYSSYRKRQDIANFNETQATIKSLFSMQEEDAAPTWQVLANDPNLDIIVRTEIVKQLFHIHSIRTFTILAEMASNPAQGDSVQQLAGLYINAMYSKGDTSLKEYIKGYYAAQGLPPPSGSVIRID